MKNFYRYLLFIILTCAIGSLNAQDGHYWTQQYGTRSMLLSGSVIGGVEDLGSVFYNPGRLGQIENPAFLLSADVYQWTRFTVTDAFGESADVNKDDFGGVPSLASGTFKVGGFLKNHRFAYSILQRQGIDLNLSYKNEVNGDIFAGVPGEEFFGGNIQLFQKVKEQWTSLTWSYPFSKKFSVGLTTTLMVFTQNKGNIIELQALAADGNTAIYRFNRGFSLDVYGLLWKGGMALDLGKAQLGLTFTTPSVNVTGEGKYRFEEFMSGVEQYTGEPDKYTTSNQSDLPVTLKKPWAIGSGITFPITKRSRIHLSGEWYSQINDYALMRANDHISQSSGDTVRFALVDKLNSVLNFGFGYELYLQEKVSLYGSFSTDYSAVPENPVALSEMQPIATNSVFTADYYHFGGGMVLNLKGVELTLGSTYTGGSQDLARPVDFPEENNEGVFDRDELAQLSWRRIRLVFSFSVKFLKDVQKKLEQN